MHPITAAGVAAEQLQKWLIQHAGKAGFSQRQLALVLNCTQASISRYADHRQPMPLAAAIAIAAIVPADCTPQLAFLDCINAARRKPNAKPKAHCHLTITTAKKGKHAKRRRTNRTAAAQMPSL